MVATKQKGEPKNKTYATKSHSQSSQVFIAHPARNLSLVNLVMRLAPSQSHHYHQMGTKPLTHSPLEETLHRQMKTTYMSNKAGER